MKILESRRLTGPNLFWSHPGAVLDVELSEAEASTVIPRWERQAERMLAAVGWGGERLTHRRFRGGASLVLSAPLDALYAATEVNEGAWESARARAPEEPPPNEGFDEAAARLRAAIAEEIDPALPALRQAARRHGVAFLTEEEETSVGMGAGSAVWPTGELPAAEDIDWEAVHDIPSAIVTGTNGKTTTTRLLAAMAAAAGRRAGLCSTDGVWVDGRRVEEGDYSGPGGARAVLRHRRVEIALLETARGGLLRRGLACERFDVAVVTNVAEDHLGEYGVDDLDALAEAKLIVHRGADRLVLNADDPLLRCRGADLPNPVTWFSLRPGEPEIRPLIDEPGDSAFYRDGAFFLKRRGETIRVAEAASAPFTLGGSARHNLSNALAAIAVGDLLGLPIAALRGGLASFESTPEDNPGRLNEFDLGGVRVLVDFAHNPHGMAALLEMAAEIPAGRRLVLLGQAGDRDDESIRELARIAWRGRPERIVLKELTEVLRGREAGEVVALFDQELAALGVPDGVVDRAASEMEAVSQALEWARPGDLLLLIIHAKRDEALSLLAKLEERGWRPGDPPWFCDRDRQL